MSFSTVLVQVVGGLSSFCPYFFLPPLLPPSEPRNNSIAVPTGMGKDTASWSLLRGGPFKTDVRTSSFNQPEEQASSDEHLPPTPSAPRGCQLRFKLKSLSLRTATSEGFPWLWGYRKRDVLSLPGSRVFGSQGDESQAPAVTRDHLKSNVVACLANSHKEKCFRCGSQSQKQGMLLLCTTCALDLH